jgi:pantothenate kinase-related protein Tda10
MTLRRAERKKAKLRIGLSGPSGSGKTYSALLLARGLASGWDKIAIIDTENGS